TMVALPDTTSTGTTILGKNSDRPVYDSQPLILNTGRSHPQGALIELEYLTIPQARETATTIGSGPYWCWGYETGMNEHGVVIGNEAIFTKAFREKAQAFRAGEKLELGLLGMDLVRLGLERGRTAREALGVLTNLVSEYGQWGSSCP
ncbi:MAG: secernin-2, partial [Anaerolineae bacterium]|nr:secernin-2 [Anaerolineae bacterium]NIN98158.1 secernin-2 [Anaerolineae bacterium]NIQ81081.1 secernin-2 [Anaerolineae bacterium]